MDSIDCTAAKKRPHNSVDLTGQRFGRLTAIALSSSINGYTKWMCRCDCGKLKDIPRKTLRNGTCKSCGCLSAEMAQNRSITHGLTRNGNIPAEYRAWALMKKRCYSPQDKRYSDYGGRGIKVCDEWLHDFEAFFAYMGNKPSKNHSIDRIDNNGNYEPGNVRWATMQEQARNKRNNRIITFNGESKTVIEWAKTLGIRETHLYSRLSSGWCHDCVINLPLAPKGDRRNYTCTHKSSIQQ